MPNTTSNSGGPGLTPNTLFYGDNLDVLRQRIADGTVDLIYIDPPFNSNRNYFVLFKDRTGRASAAQDEAFTDTWVWGEDSEAHYNEILLHCPNRDMAVTIEALRRVLRETPMMAYLVAMSLRLIEMHRVLKPTGSLYLHCDPTASHYLKIILDVVFSPQNFRSEVIWKRTSAHSSAKRFGPVHDVILYFVKSDAAKWRPLHTGYDAAYISSHYRADENGRYFTLSDLTGAGTRSGPSGQDWRGFSPDGKGRHWATTPDDLDRMDQEGRIYWPVKGGWPRYVRYLDELRGVPLQDVWDDIAPINAKASERLGYPTQKPLALLERIVSASSDPGDVVLDCFCGCGTTVTAAQKLGRQWIGIDITAVAVGIIKSRLEDVFPELRGNVPVVGFPKDLESARQLFEADPHKFQIWAATLIGAYPLTKKGADGGIDGWLNFLDLKGDAHRAVVQVKGGKVQVGQVRDFCHVVAREKATLGFFLCFGDDKNPITKPMRDEAVKEGFWTSAGGHDYPRVQILSVAGLLAHTETPRLPPQDKRSLLGFKAAKQSTKAGQPELFGE